MRLGIVGGKLQGTEAVYLAHEAGYASVLVDRRSETPASGMATEHHVFDVVAEPALTHELFLSCDAVLPACEDDVTLAYLDEACRRWGVPLLFDLAAYRISASKLRSLELFERLGVARPAPWPACGFPLIVKPSGASGSAGVQLVEDEEQLAEARARLEATGHEVVVEEFAPGPSLSLEVIGWRGQCICLQGTELEFDRYYDCKRVLAPVSIPGAEELLRRFDALGEILTTGLGLNGLMDIEVMVHGGELKVLEIDARLPSQTPTVVYHSTGINILQLLTETVANDRVPSFNRRAHRACCYQHVRVTDGAVEVLGEHVMSAAGPLRLVLGLFGADRVLTDLPADRSVDKWCATLITYGETTASARATAEAAVQRLADTYRLHVAPESSAQPGDDCR